MKKSQKLLEEFAKNEMKELEELVEEAEKEDDPNQLRNLASSFDKTYKITSIKILGKTIDFNLLLNFNENNGVVTFQAKVGSSTYKIYSKTLAKSGVLAKGDVSVNIIKIPFCIGPIPLKFQVKAKADYSLSYTIKVVNQDLQGTIKANANGYLDGSLTVSIVLASAGLGIEGRILGIEGSLTAGLVSRKITPSVNLYIGPLKVYVKARLLLKKWKKTLYTSSYITKKLI